MITLKRVLKRWEGIWEIFAPFHYFMGEQRENLNPASCKFLVYEAGILIGFEATLPLPSGTIKNAWRAHKTVVLPEFKDRWTAVSDAVAQFHVDNGKRYFSQAPYEFAKYRDEAGSLWKPTSKHNPPIKCSHEFIGTPQSAWFHYTPSKQEQLEDEIELLERVLSATTERRGFNVSESAQDMSILLKNLVRDRRGADEMKIALGRGETHYKGKKIMGSKGEPYIQRWTRAEVEDLLLERMGHEEGDADCADLEANLKERKAKLARMMTKVSS